MFGWVVGGVFSASEFGGLGFEEEEEVGLRFEEEMDLRKLEDILPKKPLEPALLVFCLMIFGKLAQKRERESLDSNVGCRVKVKMKSV